MRAPVLGGDWAWGHPGWADCPEVPAPGPWSCDVGQQGRCHPLPQGGTLFLDGLKPSRSITSAASHFFSDLHSVLGWPPPAGPHGGSVRPASRVPPRGCRTRAPRGLRGRFPQRTGWCGRCVPCLPALLSGFPRGWGRRTRLPPQASPWRRT